MFIIGIAGGSGSGKSTLVSKVSQDLPENHFAVIRQDSYYKDNRHIPSALRQEINFDHPSAIEFTLLEEHILQLKREEAIDQPVYSFQTCTRADRTIRVDPKKAIILEGILIFIPELLRNLMDIKIFIDADADERLNRIISRDVHERGRSADAVIERYEKTVKPMHLQFIEPSICYADIIIPGGGDNLTAIRLVRTIIEQKLHDTIKICN